MNLPTRLDSAIKKLYAAFHEGRLHPECCTQCAVGTICDNSDAWRHLSDAHGSPHVNYVGLVHQRLGRTINGYTPLELLKIEAVFLAACGYGVPMSRDSVRPVDPSNKDILFKGLCAVVAHLCLLDGVKDVMDYSQLFQYTPRRTSCNNEGATV